MTRFQADRTQQQATRPQWRGFRALGAALSVGAMLALVISTMAAVNPALHSWLHSDATQPDHQCFIRLLENHQLVAFDAGTVVALAPGGFEFHSQSVRDFRPGGFDALLPPGRAPPALALL